MILNSTKEQFEIDGRVIAEESYQNSVASKTQDIKEFYSWTRNLVQHVLSAGTYEGEEYQQEMEVIKKIIIG